MSIGSSAATELVALASEKSSDKRLELLRRVTDHFLENSADASSASQYLLDEIVDKLIVRLRGEERAIAASALARLPLLPDDLARSLANDAEIEVARPILQEYAGLSDNILADVASNGSQAHLFAIAGRQSLTTAVTDIVVGRGDQGVVHRLAANKGARFSQFGLRTLVSKSEKDASLRDLIVDRCDLSLEAIGRLLPLISQELASRLNVEQFEYSPAVVQEHLVSWMSDRKKSIDKVNHYIEGVKRGNLKLEEVVINLVASKRLLDVASVIAGAGDLDRDVGYNILTEGANDNIVVLLRSLGMPWKAAEAFFRLRLAKLGEGICGKMIAKVDYEVIDEATAQRVMRFLKVRRTAVANQRKLESNAA